MTVKFEKLKKTIIKCNKCPRLVKFRKKISTEKRKQYMNQTYWGKPVTGFGDINGKIMIVGLAPAAHGGTRTGRVFTGDKSSDFLYKCLHNVKIANALKCVPPGDKPLNEELKNCFGYFKSEFEILKNLKIIVALGKIAFDTCVKFYRENFDYTERVKFGHGTYFKLPNNVLLMGCYHPSPRNVNTGRINEKQMTKLFKKVKELV